MTGTDAERAGLTLGATNLVADTTVAPVVPVNADDPDVEASLVRDPHHPPGPRARTFHQALVVPAWTAACSSDDATDQSSVHSTEAPPDRVTSIFRGRAS